MFDTKQFITVMLAVVVAAVVLSFILPKISGEKSNFYDDDED